LRTDMQEHAICKPVQGTADQRWMIVIGAAFVVC